MRKIASYILIITLILGILVPSFTYGQVNLPSVSGPLNPVAQASSTQGDLIRGASQPQIQSQDSCGFICWGILFAVNNLASVVMRLASLLMWLSGTLLDYILIYTIVNFAENISKMDGIQVTWIVIRDLMNLGFVFLLLYQGIRMILGRSNNAKQVIFGIVLASILINFSLFFTKVMIDGSNVLTLGFYNAIVDTSQQEKIQKNLGGFSLESVGGSNQTGISGAYVNSLGVHRFYDKNGLVKIMDTNKQESLLIITLSAIVIFVMVAVIFFAIAIMFLVRYAVLIVLLMFSPLAVMGIAIPAVKSMQEQWWKTLMGQVIFAPLYMVMTWVVLTLINSPGFNPLASNGGDWAGLLIKGEVDNIGLIINFVIVIVLTIMTLSVSKKYATQGSTKISEWTNKVTTFAGGAVLGGAAVAGRNTIGWGADALSKNEKIKDVASRGGVGGFFAKNLIKTADRTATSTFDVRATKLADQSKKTLGVDFGKVDKKKSNYRAILEQKGKDEEAFAKKLKPNDKLYDIAKETDTYNKEQLKSVMDENKKSKDLIDENVKDKKEEVEKINKEINKLEKEIDKSVIKETKDRLIAEMETLKKESELKQKDLDSLVELSKQTTKAYNESKKNHDEYKSNEEKVLNDIYGERVKQYADKIEYESNMSVFLKDLLIKTPTLGFIGGASGNTKEQNRIIAKKIRGVTKSKTAEQEAKELLKKMRKEAKEKGEKFDDDEEEEPKNEDKGDKTEDKKTS